MAVFDWLNVQPSLSHNALLAIEKNRLQSMSRQELLEVAEKLLEQGFSLQHTISQMTMELARREFGKPFMNTVEAASKILVNEEENEV